MLPDVGMVQMYSKSANVNDLGFACTAGPPLCMDWPSSLVLQLFRQVVCSSETHCTIPYICPCFWRKHYSFYIALQIRMSHNNIGLF